MQHHPVTRHEFMQLLSCASTPGKMSDSWIQFTHSGNPNNPKVSGWPIYNGRTFPTMVFNNTCRVENDPGGAERHLWATV
jgi:para-nitrobenzyl esterase